MYVQLIWCAAAVVISIAPPVLAQPYVRTSDSNVVPWKGPALQPSWSALAGGGSPMVCDVQPRAWHGQTAPGDGGGAFSLGAFFNPAVLNASAKFAFFSQVSGSARNQGIFVADAGGASAIVRGCGGGLGSGNPGTGCGDPSPIGGQFSGFMGGTFGCPAINDHGDVLFLADVHGGSSSRGLFLFRADTQQFLKVAAYGDPSPIGGIFAAVGPGSLNNQRQVAFLASPVGTTNSNIFLWDGGAITKIAAIGDPVPGGGTFTLLGTESLGFADGSNMPVGPVPDINDSGQVSFRGIISGGAAGRGLFVWQSDTIQPYIFADAPTPAGGTFFDFQAASINKHGEIAFFADFRPTPTTFSSGWFAGSPATGWRSVLSFFDPVEDGICFGLAFSRNPMQTIDDDGDVLVWTDAQLPGGTMQERLVIRRPNGALRVIARKGEPTPLGGTIGSMDAWPSLTPSHATLGAGTPGAPNGIFSAHFAIKWRKPGDLNDDCIVNVDDLLILLASWGKCGTCAADLNGDEIVNVDDLLVLLASWG